MVVWSPIAYATTGRCQQYGTREQAARLIDLLMHSLTKGAQLTFARRSSRSPTGSTTCSPDLSAMQTRSARG
jgi:hypothetical protein